MGKLNCSTGLCDMQTMIHCCIFIFFLGGLATVSFYKNNKQEVAMHNIAVTLSNAFTNNNTDTRVFDHQVSPSSTATCDLFSGRWVLDNTSHYPLYKEQQCPHLEDTFACQTYGRKDSKYLHWKWQPHGCDFPRFDGKAIAERLRGKRLLFVGDSLNRNQWNSMICMLYSSIPGVKTAGGGLSGLLRTFRAALNLWAIVQQTITLIIELLELNPLKKHARHWIDADILIFNSFHWWRSPSGGSLLDDPNQEYEEVDSLSAYKMGLKTWSNWAQTHIDPLKTKLFFMGATATHSR
ncbi:putative PMR5 domain, PC-Esterase [Helianthus annuus]|nr:putative PMR5 domain, PC-Esterase [Helianthus annuus]